MTEDRRWSDPCQIDESCARARRSRTSADARQGAAEHRVSEGMLDPSSKAPAAQRAAIAVALCSNLVVASIFLAFCRRRRLQDRERPAEYFGPVGAFIVACCEGGGCYDSSLIPFPVIIVVIIVSSSSPVDPFRFCELGLRPLDTFSDEFRARFSAIQKCRLQSHSDVLVP